MEIIGEFGEEFGERLYARTVMKFGAKHEVFQVKCARILASSTQTHLDSHKLPVDAFGVE